MLKIFNDLISMKFSPSPTNINYMWNFGSLLMFIFSLQFISGLFISFHYLSEMNNSFHSISHITREVNMGWMIRLFHINGASIYFMLMFIHIMKNMYNSSWKMKIVWLSGLMIFILSMLVAFVGYVLPWGQMSFWAATVITNLMSVIPYFGSTLVEWIWGGFSVSYPTLMRFFSFHFLIPFIIMFLIVLHILFLHIKGSSNTISSSLNLDKISFDPYFTIKDILGVIMVLFFMLMLMFYNPYYSVDAENFIEANSLITPVHIKPEWYFLFAYAILRSIPSKIGGVVALMMSIIMLYLKVFQKSHKVKYMIFKKINLFMFFYTFILLSYLGGMMIEYPFEVMSKIFSFLYFLFLIMM